MLTVGGSSAQQASRAQAKQASFDAAGLLSPVEPAPPLALRNYLGQPVNIDSYRGKAVLVTFLYTNCPDVCPLITSNLRVAQNLMGPAASSKAADHRRLGRPTRRHAERRGRVPRAP